MDLFKKITKIYKKLNKSSMWTKVLLFLSVLLIVLLITKTKTNMEGFTQSRDFILKTNDNLYDNFYCQIYDEILYDKTKNDFELREITRLYKDEMKSVLDVGSGTGRHVKSFTNMKIKAKGIDKSGSMVKYSKQQYPGLDIQKADVMNNIIFAPGSFTHITCFYFTVYYIEDKGTFFSNCYNWLAPGGKLIIHMVNRDMFDPMLNLSVPVKIVSPQKHAKERLTKSVVKFNDFQYKSNFLLDKENNKATFNETMKDDATGNVRKNVHTLYMDTQKNILSLAKSVGFILEGKFDMIKCQYDYQYLYILKKPD